MEDLSVNDQILLNFPPRLRKNIKEIWKDGKIGISAMNIKIRVNTSKFPVNEYRETYTDSFLIEIPYAGKQLHWEVIFNAEDYDYPPDFDFNNDPFLFDPDVNVISNYIPSLANWNVDNPKSLICVIKELMSLYKNYQLDRLQNENKFFRLNREYEALKSEVPNFEDNVEVFIDHNDAVHFLIGININFSDLPPYIQPVLLGKDILNPTEDTATLRVSFLKPDCSKIQNDLQLSPRLEQVIGNSSTLHIPLYNKDGGLINYVPEITKLLEDRVEQIVNHYKLKNEFISFLLSLCGYNIIEYDNVLFSKASVLFKVDNFYAIVCIGIGNKFPHEKPKVSLCSVYHLQYEKPISVNLDNYPYSPRWKPAEMIRRLITNLETEIPKFQIHCQNVAKS